MDSAVALDIKLIKHFYDTEMVTNFPLEDELDPWTKWRDRLLAVSNCEIYGHEPTASVSLRFKLHLPFEVMIVYLDQEPGG